MDDYQNSRHAVFGKYVHKQSRGIEIGPGYRPTFPKSQGYQISVVDHCDTDALRAKYQADGNVPSQLVEQIESVDAVWTGGSYVSTPGLPPEADYVVACHVIEHAVDIAGFLLDCSSLLKPGGFLLLAIPERRCVLDYYRPSTTLGDVLLAHLNPSAYDLKSEMDEVWYGALYSNSGAWTCEHLALCVSKDQYPEPQHPVEQAGGIWRKKYQNYKNISAMPVGKYRDAHRWVLDEINFQEIVAFLRAYAGLNLAIETMPGTYGCEFYAVLRKLDASNQIDVDEIEWARLQSLKDKRQKI